jgi:hypothetical protein
LLKPAQSFLNAGDAIGSGKHGNGSPVSLQIATARHRCKLPSEYPVIKYPEIEYPKIKAGLSAYWMARGVGPAGLSLDPGIRCSI